MQLHFNSRLDSSEKSQAGKAIMVIIFGRKGSTCCSGFFIKCPLFWEVHYKTDLQLNQYGIKTTINQIVCSVLVQEPFSTHI
ncbi:hypothetical protein XENTR_v10011145 [Xenopus tropicalis]|nr:hypothetical protein XENTR_v10011145 [Xenopus tropicalis]